MQAVHLVPMHCADLRVWLQSEGAASAACYASSAKPSETYEAFRWRAYEREACLHKGSAQRERPQLRWRGMQGPPNEQVNSRKHLQSHFVARQPENSQVCLSVCVLPALHQSIP